ncbi:MAG: helix-turn-helix domain-containing protein [Gaiellaceae bacterium]
MTEAAQVFEQIGANGFAARAHDELERLGGRRTADGLTATEHRVAELVAQGLTNSEVATALVVTVSTVEAHLTRIYAKLGIRSRAQLARSLANG